MKRIAIQFFYLAVISVIASGCAGYQVGDVKPASYAGINNLHVPPFKNLTLEPRISSLITNAVLKEIQADGTYSVSSRRNADAVLMGTIQDVDKRQLRAIRTNTLESDELHLRLFVDFYLADPVTGARIDTTEAPYSAEKSGSKYNSNDRALKGRQGRVIGETIQFIDPSFQVGERSATAVAAEDLAEKLVSQLSNGW